MVKRWIAALLGAAACAPAFAQVRAGSELQVNQYTTHRQDAPTVVMQRDGGFVVVWSSWGQDGDRPGVFARRYDALGIPRGGEFQVNTYTTGLQSYRKGHDVDVDDAGNFVIVWSSYPEQGGDRRGIFGRRFDANGNPLGPEFHVNTFTMYQQGQMKHGPRVATAPGGSFVVVWDSVAQDGDNYGVFARRYDAAGAALGAEFQVNTYTTDRQLGAGVDMDRSGNFVVVWTGYLVDPPTKFDIFAQRFDAAGARIGGEFRVNTFTTGNQGYFGLYGPTVAVRDDGAFTVVWDDFSHMQAVATLVSARRFGASGPIGDEFAVTGDTHSDERASEVSSDALGNFVVAWQDVFDGSGWTPLARRWSRGGTPRGNPFQVNTYTTLNQYYPSVASDDVGNFVVAWSSSSHAGDGLYTDVFVQRFGGLRPQALSADPAGNRVIEPGETAVVQPAWRNTNGAALTFGGTLTDIGGPAGPSYAIPDGAATYGTVANGASGACTDCYSVSISGTRPVTHWDATAVESITPDALGQQKQWVLHVGASFTDVATGSPFYPFIETLLHRGITAGCTASTYCPSTVTTREQMAVFVLVAREGSAYFPPACTTPVFGDVPAASPFCRWIEELARRGVVGGCGGGNYCPGADVTREQMAVFVLRTLDPALNPPNCTTPVFADVPVSSPFCKWIEELARRGVVGGCGGGNYCPTAGVSREQMGVFLGVTFGLTLYGP